jgi:hypothetical protein
MSATACSRPAGAAKNDERSFRAAQHLFQRVEFGVARPRLDRRRRQRLRRSASEVSMSSGSEITTGPGPARGRDRESACHQFGNALGAIDLDHPFGDVAKEALVIHLLERLAFACMAGDLPDEEQHRDRILHGDVDAGRGVGRARPARHEADAGLPGQPSLAIGHHRGAAFLAADDGVDPGVVQSVEYGQIAFARHAENALDAVGFEGLDDQLSAGSQHWWSVFFAGVSTIRGNMSLSCRANSSTTPLCPVGHLPLKGGDRPAARVSPITNVAGRAQVEKLLISPLEGEMSVRTEGGR